MTTFTWIRDSILAACMGASIYGVAVYLVNHWVGLPVMKLQCLILALAFGFMAWSWILIIYRFIHGTYSTALIHLLIHILLSLPYIYLLVYGVLPYLDQQVHLDEVPFDIVQFMSRSISAVLLTGGFCVSYFLVMLVFRPDRLIPSKTTLKRLLTRIGDQEDSVPISTHFLRNMMVSVGDFATMHPGAKGRKALNALISLVEYVLATSAWESHRVDWRKEWEQVGNLSQLAEIIHGAEVVKLVKPTHQVGILIPVLAWLTLLENALLHGQYSGDQPICITLMPHGHTLEFICQNKYTVHSRRKYGQGTGLSWLSTQGNLMIKDDGVHFEAVFSRVDKKAFLRKDGIYGKTTQLYGSR